MWNSTKYYKSMFHMKFQMIWIWTMWSQFRCDTKIFPHVLTGSFSFFSLNMLSWSCVLGPFFHSIPWYTLNSDATSQTRYQTYDLLLLQHLRKPMLTLISCLSQPHSKSDYCIANTYTVLEKWESLKKKCLGLWLVQPESSRFLERT